MWPFAFAVEPFLIRIHCDLQTLWAYFLCKPGKYKATTVQPCDLRLGMMFTTRPIQFLRKHVVASQGPRRSTCDQCLHCLNASGFHSQTPTPPFLHFNTDFGHANSPLRISLSHLLVKRGALCYPHTIGASPLRLLSRAYGTCLRTSSGNALGRHRPKIVAFISHAGVL